MPIRHVLLVLLVIFAWGINFVFVKLGLEEISPLFMCALRFILASIPAIFFVKRPTIPMKLVAGYGLFMFAIQFAFVFTGMHVGMTAGMASLIMQVQIFFSIFFAVMVFGERLQLAQILGALVAFLGIGVVAFHFDQQVTLIGFLCILAAAATWGVGNLLAKKMNTDNLISVIVWSSFIICFPMLGLSYLVEGPEKIIGSIEHLSWKGAGAMMYIVYVSTWLGYGTWNWLLGRYAVSVVVPFTLLIPVVGMISSIFIFGEPFQLWKLVACLLVISGLCINILGSRLTRVKVEPKVVVLDAS